jgi:hypothetical protein
LCLEHEPKFRRLFWDEVCCAGKERNAWKDLEIEVEPKDWADLRVTAKGPRGRVVVVVECKTGDDLAPKQNPNDRSFFNEGFGYGWFLANFAKSLSAEARYVVLGAKERLDLPLWKIVGGRIRVQQRHWACLQGRDQSSLVRDLFRSLGLMGVTDFLMDEAKKAKVRGFGQAADAKVVLDVLGGSPNDFLNWKVKIEPDSAGVFNIGAYLKTVDGQEKDLSPVHHSLIKVAKPATEFVCWFGYESDPKNFRRSVWFFSSTLKRSQRIEKAFKAKGYEAEADWDGSENYCAIWSRQLPENDLDWFQSVIDTARTLNGIV